MLKKAIAGNIAEFEGSVKSDDERGDGTEDYVKIEPMTGIALAREPAPFLAKGIEIYDEKEQYAKQAELHAHGAARPQNLVFGRVGTLGGA
jgi:hypothetical protein